MTEHAPLSAVSFDLVRLTKSKKAVDLVPNTIRKIRDQYGLNFYRHGRAVFFSRSELTTIIKQNGLKEQLAWEKANQEAA